MIIHKKTKHKKAAFIVLALLAIPLYSKADDWLWKVDKYEYSVDEFSKDYKSYLQLTALQMGISTSALMDYLIQSKDSTDPRVTAVLEQLRPDVFGENYISISLLKKHAIENKYFEQEDTKQIEKFMHNYIMVQLYLNQVVSRIKVEISDEEVEKEWQNQRAKNENLKSIPIEQGLALMKQQMAQSKQDFLRKEFVKSLFEKYKLEKNADYVKMMNSVKVTFP